MELTIINFVITLLLSSSTTKSCEYHDDLILGQQSDIYNSEYPSRYAPATSCVWTLRSATGTQIFLSCNVTMPASPNCDQDRLLISRTGNRTDASPHCGSEQFSLSSKETDTYIELYVPPNSSTGGTFFCTAVTKSTNFPDTRSVERQQACDCGWTQTTRIVGGIETGINEFPYMAALIYLQRLFCGATIISDRFSLTAAHCVFNRDLSGMFLLVGDHNIATGQDTPHSALYRVNAYEVYPGYNQSTQKNDIAIVRTDSQMSFSIYVGPVCLPFKYTFQSFNGQSVVILGWGQVQFTGPTSDTLQKALVSVISNNQCNSMQNEPITDGELCTYSNEERDSCQNDSGGPVLWFDATTQRYVLIGIISHGEGCATSSPAINTRVTVYLQWIISRTSANYCVK